MALTATIVTPTGKKPSTALQPKHQAIFDAIKDKPKGLTLSELAIALDIPGGRGSRLATICGRAKYLQEQGLALVTNQECVFLPANGKATGPLSELQQKLLTLVKAGPITLSQLLDKLGGDFEPVWWAMVDCSNQRLIKPVDPRKVSAIHRTA